MDDETYYRLRRAIRAANEGRVKDLGDFAQYAEEPAWRARLVAELSKFDAYADAWLPVVEPFILAAEERGRREALAEAAEKIRPTTPEPLCCEACFGEHHVLGEAADLIDPDKP